jgi:hypothetical protein
MLAAPPRCPSFHRTKGASVMSSEPASGSTPDPVRNPLQRSTPLGGAVGVAIVAIVPLAALALFLVFGLLGYWAWSWVFFLLIPVAGWVVYGLRSGGSSSSST